MSDRQLTALFLTMVMVGAAFAGFVTFGSEAAAAGNNTQTPARFEITSAGNTQTGNLTITVEAKSSEPVKNFKFWYEDLSGGGEKGPVTLSDSAIKGAQYGNGTVFTRGDTVSTNTQSTTVTFTFDSSSTDYDYVSNRFRINATAYDTTYSSADTGNRSVWTENFYTIDRVEDHNNKIASGVIPIVPYNATSNESYNAKFYTGSSIAFHCQGVSVSSTCTDPDDGSASVLHTKSDGGGGGGEGGSSSTTQIGAPLALNAYLISESNASGKAQPSPGSVTLTADQPTAVRFTSWSVNAASVTVTNTSSGNVVWRKTNPSRGAPIFLKPNTRYNFTFRNQSTFGTLNRSLVAPTKGISQIRFEFATGSTTSTATVTGQIVNESGSPVPDAVVMAQPEGFGSSTGELIIYNATTTDSNGVFTMSLPETDESRSTTPPEAYSFRIVSGDTDGGTPVYYPTVDSNPSGTSEGYTVSGQTVIPPMTIEKGGRVDIAVKPGKKKSKLPGFAFASLSEVSTNYPSPTRTTNANGFQQFALGGNAASSADIALMSPTTGSGTQVTYNVWNLGFGPGSSSTGQYLCANSPSVSQGSAVSSSCTLAEGGSINLSVTNYTSIRKQTSSQSASFDDGFFFENELVIRNATTGNVVTYLGPKGAQQFFVDAGESSNNISIPVPAGKYELALRPADEDARHTTVNDTNPVSVTAGSTTDVTLDRSKPFEMRPDFDRTPRSSLTKGADNTIAVYVNDPKTENRITSGINVSAQLLYLNGTTAAKRVPLSYNSTDGTWDTTTFNPKDLGVSAGSYHLALTSSYAENGRTYNSTIAVPIQVSDFKTAVSLESRTVSPGSSLKGTIYAYDAGSGVDAKSSNVNIALTNDNGRVVKSVNPTSGVSSGQGTFSVTMPDDSGFYRLSVTVTKDGTSKQGLAERFVRASQLTVDAETDRRTYAPKDTVELTVEATNATTGSAASDASVTAKVNGKQVKTTTNANGVAQISLKPSKITKGNTWQRGYPIDVTVAQETDSGVVTKTVRTGFEVQQVEVRAEPTARTFSTDQNVTIDVLVGGSGTINNVKVTRLDGDKVDIGGSNVTKLSGDRRRINLGSARSVGEHLATVQVNTSKGNETIRTGFRVRQYAIAASLASRQVDVNEDVNVTVAVRKPDGTTVDQTVSASLNSTNPVRSVDTASGSTGSDGEVTLSLSPSSSGFHFVKVDVGEQSRFLGLRVTSAAVRLTDASGSTVEGYDANSGTSEKIYVNATSGGSALSSGTALAFVPTRSGITELGSASISSGDATISYTVPESLSAREYPLIIQVKQSGAPVGSAVGSLTVTGSNALAVSASTNASAYAPSETALFTATVTNGSGEPVSSTKVDFLVQSEGSAEKRVATVTTNSDGVATYDYDIPAGASTGQYVVETRLNSSQSIRDYSGYRLRSLDVAVEAEDGPFTPGEKVNLTVLANDTGTGNAITATGGSVTLLLPGSNVEKTLSLSGSAPYSANITLPDDSSITGTRSLSVTLTKDGASDTDATLIEVEDASESANLTIERPVVAGEAANVTVNGTVDTTAVLTAYSPGAGTVAYNSSVSVSSTSDTETTMTIGSAGNYIVKLSVPGVGTVTKFVSVQSSGGTPTVTTGTSVSDNSTTFNKTEDIYIKTNQSGLTATVIGQNATYEVALDSQSGDTYYGVLSTARPVDVYLVRLDSANATSINDTIMEVTA